MCIDSRWTINEAKECTSIIAGLFLVEINKASKKKWPVRHFFCFQPSANLKSTSKSDFIYLSIIIRLLGQGTFMMSVKVISEWCVIPWNGQGIITSNNRYNLTRSALDIHMDLLTRGKVIQWQQNFFKHVMVYNIMTTFRTFYHHHHHFLPFLFYSDRIELPNLAPLYISFGRYVTQIFSSFFK